MKEKLDISIGIKWDSSDFDLICSQSELFLKQINLINQNIVIPVHWVIPCSPFLETTNSGINSLIEQIKNRLFSAQTPGQSVIPLDNGGIETLKVMDGREFAGDRIISPGYSDSIWPFLNDRELEKEFKWINSNPWQSGIYDVFNITPSAILNKTAAFSGTDFFHLLPDKGFKYIGVNTPVFHPAEVITESAEHGITFFYYISVNSGTGLKFLKNQIKDILKDDYKALFLLLEINSRNGKENNVNDNLGLIKKVAEWLSQKYTIRFAAIDQIEGCQNIGKIISRPLEYSDSPEILSNNIINRFRLMNAAGIRESEIKTDRDYKNLLNYFTCIQPVITFASNKQEMDSRRDNRMSDYSMQGEAQLAGFEFSVYFSNGKLRNLGDNIHKALFEPFKTRAYIKINKKEYDFENVSAFSIADETVRGLREILKINVPDNIAAGSQVTDYIFIDEFPLLMVSSRIVYPSFNLKTEIEAIIPFEIPLFRTGTSVILYSFLKTIKKSHCIDVVDVPVLIHCDMLCIPYKDHFVRFGFPSFPKSSSNIIEVILKSSKNKPDQLIINLFGTYKKAAVRHYNGIAETFTFYIGLSQSCPSHLPYFPADVLKQIPDQMLSRE